MGNMNKDMRNMTMDGSTAKNVDNTKLNDTNAKEWSETVSRDNPQEEYITNKKVSGPFGAKGHGG